MKKSYFLLLICIFSFFLNFIASAQCGSNILVNGDFESPTQPLIGNNLTNIFTLSGGWTMTGGAFNVIRTNNTSYGGGPDNAQNGIQYLDITNGAGTVYQDFSIATNSTIIVFGGYFSSREQAQNYVNWTASISIVELPSLNVVATSNSRSFTNADGGFPAEETWYYINGITTLPTGNYRYVANFGDFGNFNAAFVYPNCLLPIKLQNFNGSYLNNTIQLHWTVNYQSNFAHFEIERSADGIQFLRIGQHTSTNTRLYNYIDYTPQASIHYYRLKMIDKDGTFSYSNIIKIQTSNRPQLAIVSNPVIDHLNITGLRQRGEIHIVDMTGKLIQTKNIQSSSLSLDVSFLHKGIYVLRYIDGQIIETKKFVKE